MGLFEPFADPNLASLFRRQVAARADHPFVVWRDLDGHRAEWSYAEAARIVDGLAAGLWDLGVRAGDRVGVHAGNCPEFIFTVFAIAELGAVMVATNVRSSIDELTDYLARAQCSVVFT
ncbi:MAG TPA: class I adenylate-forming enzyme family protein, partial [Ilumatobacteraceae bacterium]|nr:class I adenylate-forming enzyme family protein [Ilumatobacteraceae bacterium]